MQPHRTKFVAANVRLTVIRNRNILEPRKPPRMVISWLEANWVRNACIPAKMDSANTRDTAALTPWAIAKAHRR